VVVCRARYAIIPAYAKMKLRQLAMMLAKVLDIVLVVVFQVHDALHWVGM